MIYIYIVTLKLYWINGATIKYSKHNTTQHGQNHETSLVDIVDTSNNQISLIVWIK